MTILKYNSSKDNKYRFMESLKVYDNYCSESITLSDIKAASKEKAIQLFYTMLGNFSYPNIFIGRYDDFESFLIEEFQENIENGYLSFSEGDININIAELKYKLKR